MIKNILFDFGNVFVDLDMESVNEGIQTYIGMSFQGIYYRYGDVFDQFETGHLSENEFLDAFAKIGVPRNKVLEIWNAMVLGIPQARIDFLKNIQGDFNLYLYSNTNSLHEKELDRLMWEQHSFGLAEFRSRFFDDTWFSHEIGFRKPGREGFELILDQTGILPSETLFIDDSPSYLVGAQDVGMHTVLHNPDNDITAIFSSYMDEVKLKIN